MGHETLRTGFFSYSISETVTNYYQTCGRCLEDLTRLQEDLVRSLEQPPNKDFLSLRALFRSETYKTYLANLERLRTVCVRGLQRSKTTDDIAFANGELHIIKILEALPTEVDKRLEESDA
jgi:hypothetical protein